MTQLKSLPHLIFTAFACIVVAFFVYSLARYWNFAGYLDHAEALITTRAWQFANGAPLYQPNGDGIFLIVPYGPISFLANAIFLKIFGGSIVVSKAGGIASAFLSLVFFCLFVCRTHGSRWLTFGAISFVSIQLASVPYTFWSRPDPQAILLICAALLATSIYAPGTAANKWTSAIAIALAVGLAINMKAHFFVFLIPLVIRYCDWREWKIFICMALVIAVTMATPFIIPGISLQVYQDGLVNLVSARSIDFHALPFLMRRSLLYVLPPVIFLGIALIRGQRPPFKDILYLGALFIAVAISLYPASVEGSSWYQMNLIFPITLDLTIRFARCLDTSPRSQFAMKSFIAAILIILTVNPQKRFHRTLDELSWLDSAAREVTSIADKYAPEAVEMGLGAKIVETYPLSQLKAILGFRGYPITIDGWSDMEARFIGVDNLPGKIAHISNCETHYWITPKGESPFSLNSYFGGPIYAPALSRSFLDHYKIIEQGRYFDVWHCQLN